MDAEFGDQLKDKVDCIGLHGDYEAGLQFIRDGKLTSLRDITLGRSSQLEEAIHSNSISPEPLLHLATPDKPEASPDLSATSDSQITPGVTGSPLPSAITDDDVTSSGGSWSPIEVANTQHLYTWNTSSESKGLRPLHLVFLGSSLGNFPREAAAPFLRSLPLHQGDTLLIGLDGRPVPGLEGRHKVEIAYNDPAGHTRAFEEHGWDVVRVELGLQRDAGVEFVGRYNEVTGELARQRTRILLILSGRHEAYYKSKERQTLHLPSVGSEVTLEKDELLNIEWSYKVSMHPATQPDSAVLPCRSPRAVQEFRLACHRFVQGT